MEESLSFCQTHNIPYSSYCHDCYMFFCTNCCQHNQNHLVLPLFCVYTSDMIDKYLEHGKKILDTIYTSLSIIPQVEDELLRFNNIDKKNNESNPLEEEERSFTITKELEDRTNEQINKLEGI